MPPRAEAALLLRPQWILLVVACFVGTVSALQRTECWGPCPSGFRWAFMPTHDTFRFAFLRPPATATQWQASLISDRGDGPALVAEVRGNTTATIAPVGQIWRLPGVVQPGFTYTLRLRLADAANRTVNESAGAFNRSARPWERLELGQDQVVIPPFEPITTTNASEQCCAVTSQHCCVAQVSVVGRNHSVHSAGLWEQVSIAARDASVPVRILASPVALVAVSGNVEHTAAGRMPPAVVASSEVAAVVKASWRAGPLAGTTTAAYDYDGCVKLTIDLEPTTAAVQELTLRVPLHDAEAPLFHTVTDYLREHKAGRLPPGEGEVYNTTDAPRHQLQAPFVPYIWVGGVSRGIAVFSDNTRDWLAAEPTYSITRSNGTLTLHVHLISRGNPLAGAPLTRPRTIVLGMMASPAKPQPTSPVASARAWWPDLAVPFLRRADTVAATLIGNSWYWGTAGNDVGFYPFKHNESIYHQLTQARGTGEFDVETWFSSQWAPLYAKDCQEHHRRCPQCPNASSCSFDQHEIEASIGCAASDVKQAFHDERSGSHNLVFPYTNPQSVQWDEDTAEFMDEWTSYDITDPRWEHPTDSSMTVYGSPDAGFRRTHLNWTVGNASQGRWQMSQYYRDPVRSYADMALWYQTKMASWADGVYYDNTFLTASFNLVPGPGWVDPDVTQHDGSPIVHDGVNLWAWRDFMRRTAVMQSTTLGRRQSRIYVHKTNVNIIPLLSWATISYDWEWRDSAAGQGGLCEQDVQTRNLIGCDEHGSCNDTGFILAQTSGEQTGTVPIAIGSGLRGPNCTQRPDLPAGDMCLQWLYRTHYATTIVHEVRPQCPLYSVDLAGRVNFSCARRIPGSPDGRFEETPAVCNISNILIDHGYADQSCTVYRFWDKPLPVSISAVANLSSTNVTMVLPLLVRCQVADLNSGSKMVRVLGFFSSFGPGGMVEVAFDRASLGLTSTASAVDAETGASIEKVGDATFRFRLDRHSFRIVVVKADGE